MNSVAYIFKKHLTNNRLEHYDQNNIVDFDKKYEEICKWCDAANDTNLDKIKETAIQGTFMTRVFDQILGYLEIIDNGECYNQEREKKTELDSTEADAALGYFNINTGEKDVRAVIELKAARTPLDKKQSRNNHLTPVEQAFSYANKNGKHCGWVIVSNYIETRLYKSNSMLEYETFDIRKMNDKKEFLRFYYFLCKDNLISKCGKSIIDEFYQENEVEGINITNEFYGKYKTIRKNLFANLKENNPKIDEIILFTKAQKIMDRLIFICFCEDCGLLPNNTLQNLVVNSAKNSLIVVKNQLWQYLCGLFRAIDQGNPPMNINRYNGGLFKDDEVLNNLIISDDIIESFTQLSVYDFNSELNVNILGQIFEQSISDIEQIKNEIQGIKSENNKQKDDGVFYTPYYVTQYIVEQTVGSYLNNKKEELKTSIFKNGAIEFTVKNSRTKRDNKFNFSAWIDIPNVNENTSDDEKIKIEAIEKLHLHYWTEYEKILKNIKICDPSCGSGAFLNQCFDYLHKEMNFVLDMKHDLNIQKSLFDIDKEILQNNLYGVDINPESVEITKLSLWLKTAKKDQLLTSLDNNIKCGNSIVSDKNVVENAFDWQKEFPVVFAQGGFDIVVGNPPYGAKLTEVEKQYLKEKYITTEYNYDTYKTFFELGINILKQNGYLGYITSNTFFALLKGATKLRKFLFDNNIIENIVELYGVFKAVVEPAIIVLHKKKPIVEDLSVLCMPRNIKPSSDFISFAEEKHFTQDMLKQEENYIFNYRISSKDSKIIKQLKENEKFYDFYNITTGTKPYQINKGNPKQTKEIVTNKPYTKKVKEDITWFPYMCGSTMHRFTNTWKFDGTYIKYGEWLAEPRYISGEKIVIRQSDDRLIATIDNIGVNNNTLHTITMKENKNISLLYALGILNSELLNWYHKKENFLEDGKQQAEVKGEHVKKLPLAIGNTEQILKVENCVKKLLELCQKRFDTRYNFVHYIDKKYNPKSISSKLKMVEDISFDAWIKELKRQKCTVLAKDEMDILTLFEETVDNISQLSKSIQNFAEELNKTVFEIYGLANDDILNIQNEYTITY